MAAYYRFWLRSCVVFCPLTFVILYGSGVRLTYALLSGLGVGVGGLLLMTPFILAFGNMDRKMWSQEEHLKRRLAYREKLRRLESDDEEEAAYED